MSNEKEYIFLDFPHFETEEEEAEWWDTHQDEVSDWFLRAEAAGVLRRGLVPQG